MTLLVVNAGSSSLKLRALDEHDEPVATADVTRWYAEDSASITSFVADLPPVAAVGHRVVHGGDRFRAPVLVDDAVVSGIDAVTDLAPLHQPRALAGIRAARSALPDVPHVACFDTAFHATLPAAASTYALPADWRARWRLRRYGFHGLSHAYAARRAAHLLGRNPGGVRVVSCHLGAGASLCAVAGGESVDTTMGFTPLAGLVMATRSGDVDPGLLLWLLTEGKLSVEELADGLEHRSGLAGLAEGSGDLRSVRSAADAGDPRARVALEVTVHRLRQGIAAMAAAMEGLDVLLFTGGIGEHDADLRAEAAAGLSFLGVGINGRRNAAAHGDSDISAHRTPVRTLVVEAREDVEIAAQVRRVLAGEGLSPTADGPGRDLPSPP